MSKEGDVAAAQLESALVPDSALQPKEGGQPPTPNPGPGTGTASKEGDTPSEPGKDFSWLDPKPAEGDKGTQPPAKKAAPKAGEEGDKTPAQAAAWSPEKFLSDKIADPSEFLKGDEKIKQFGDMRDLVGNAMKHNQALELENAQLKAGRTFAGDDGDAMPETEAVQKLQDELSALKPDAEAWKEEKARRDLATNQALRKEFDAPRAGILRELEATANEVDLAEEHVQEFLKLPSEFKQAKWIEENVEDETAAGLFRAKGASFLGLTVAKENILDTENVFDELAEWEERELAFGNQMAIKLDANIARQYQAASVKAFETLTGENGDLYFTGTDAGKQALADIQQRFADGNGFSPEETVLALASKGKGEAFEALANRFAQQLVEARNEIQRLSGIDPTARMLGNEPLPPGGGAATGAGEIDPFSTGDGGVGGDVKPLVSPEQLAESLRGS